jgi:hypothetical protein
MQVREQEADGADSDSGDDADECVRRREEPKLPLRALPTNAPAEVSAVLATGWLWLEWSWCLLQMKEAK